MLQRSSQKFDQRRLSTSGPSTDSNFLTRLDDQTDPF